MIKLCLELLSVLWPAMVWPAAVQMCHQLCCDQLWYNYVTSCGTDYTRMSPAVVQLRDQWCYSYVTWQWHSYVASSDAVVVQLCRQQWYGDITSCGTVMSPAVVQLWHQLWCDQLWYSYATSYGVTSCCTVMLPAVVRYCCVTSCGVTSCTVMLSAVVWYSYVTSCGVASCYRVVLPAVVRYSYVTSCGMTSCGTVTLATVVQLCEQRWHSYVTSDWTVELCYLSGVNSSSDKPVCNAPVTKTWHCH